jgi:predicted dehydrogenase
MYDSVRVGILGCAKIAERYLIPAFQSSRNYKLVGISSRSNDSASRFAKKFSMKIFETYEDMIISNSIDAIYIPLPNSLHYKWIKKSLDNNLHVLVEKSLACNFDEVSNLTKMAKSKNLVLLENFQFRFHSQLHYIESLITNGEIGCIRNIRSSFGFPPFQDSENIRYKKELGGGALLDAGAYPLKIVQMFMSDDIHIASSNLYIDESFGVDTYGSFQVNDRKLKITAQCAFGFDNFYQCNIELWGSKGKIQANRIFTSPPGSSSTVEIQNEDGDRSILIPPDDHFANMLQHFFNLINNRSDIEREHSQNMNQAKLLEQIRNKNR